jgi:hypothetical protein
MIDEAIYVLVFADIATRIAILLGAIAALVFLLGTLHRR